MKKFAKELFTNRFGIVLATLNICYFVSNKFISFIFAHPHGENCNFYKKHFLMLYPIFERSPDWGFLINLPSLIASRFQGFFFLKIFPNLCNLMHMKIQIVFFTFFIALQWLFIAWLSYKIAQKIRGN
jgi:hypothetical protein